MSYTPAQLAALDVAALDAILDALRDDALSRRRALDALQAEIADVRHARDARLKRAVV